MSKRKMMASQVVEAHSLLAEAGKRLCEASPEGLQACEGLVERACSMLRQARHKASPAELAALKKEMAVVGQLLEQASNCYSDRVRELKTAAAGYGATGEIEEAPAVGGAVAVRA